MRLHYQVGDKLRAIRKEYELEEGEIVTFKAYHDAYLYNKGESAAAWFEEKRGAYFIDLFEPNPVEE